LLLLPFQSESHWTLLALERQQSTMPSQQEKQKEQTPEEGPGGCGKCIGIGCLLCNASKARAFVERIDKEKSCIDPVKNSQPLSQSQPWKAVRYYDTLFEPSEINAKLAVGILDALQSVGLSHHLNADMLAQERHNSRMQQDVTSCGFWVLHYIEEELRRFNGEGCFSFYPDLDARLTLLNNMADRLKE
jgi:hypothetical protein